MFQGFCWQPAGGKGQFFFLFFGPNLPSHSGMLEGRQSLTDWQQLDCNSGKSCSSVLLGHRGSFFSEVCVLVYLAHMLRVKFKVRYGIRKEFSISWRLARIPSAANSLLSQLPRLAQGDANNKLQPRDLRDFKTHGKKPNKKPDSFRVCNHCMTWGALFLPSKGRAKDAQYLGNGRVKVMLYESAQS